MMLRMSIDSSRRLRMIGSSEVRRECQRVWYKRNRRRDHLRRWLLRGKRIDPKIPSKRERIERLDFKVKDGQLDQPDNHLRLPFLDIPDCLFRTLLLRFDQDGASFVRERKGEGDDSVSSEHDRTAVGNKNSSASFSNLVSFSHSASFESLYHVL